ncbi:hypothetical protein DFH29DRAFT_890071 [Suillus ampliporus]|nr:hypothetical protein DFH29DRAFT_890071 [Suillus ampliporus]
MVGLALWHRLLCVPLEPREDQQPTSNLFLRFTLLSSQRHISMNSVPGREVLQAMKRVDIQRLCKEYGVKANLKTEALIDLLLDASQPQPSRNIPAQPPPRSTSIRIISQSGARPRGHSSGSVIIHDTDDEEEAIEQVEMEQEPEEHKPLPPPVDPTPRARKAKDTQYRLGVGRPIIAGGSGARAVTKSISVSRSSKRAKSMKNVKPSEETIAEEPEPEPEPIPAGTLSEQAGPSDTLLISQHNSIPLQTQTEGMAQSSSQIVESAVAAALVPVQKELEDQKAQLSELRDKVSGIIEIFETQIRGLTAEIERLRAQASGHAAETVLIQRQKETPQRIPDPPSTPKRVRSPVDPLGDPYLEKPESSTTSSDSSNPNGLVVQQREINNPNLAGSLLPGFHTTLGKRPRDSNASTTTAFFELGQEEELSETEIAKRIARPAQKRAKLGSSDTAEEAGECSGPSSGAQDTDPGPSQPPRPGFSMLKASLISSQHLQPPLMSAPTTVGEPLNPFRFGFTSTPAHVAFPTAMGTFPHPEPPTRQSERFGIFGHHREAAVNNEVASGLGLTVLRTAATEMALQCLPHAVPCTGTELEGDTRGVATGFWAGGRR